MSTKPSNDFSSRSSLVPPRKPLPSSLSSRKGSRSIVTTSSLGHSNSGYTSLPLDDLNTDPIFEPLNISNSPTPSISKSRAPTSSIRSQDLSQGPKSAITQHRPSNDDSLGKAPPYDGPGFVPKRDTVSRYWIWETSACIFSLTCMAAIIGVLVYEDGKELDQWNLLIAPNAVVSFLATIGKSSFLLTIQQVISQLKWLNFQGHSNHLTDLKLFDEASRGPFGSAQLIFSKHRKAVLGTIAALIIVLASLIDPFIQLVFSFPSRPSIDQSAHATFQTTNMYDPNQLILDSRGKTTEASAMSVSMQAAVVRGLYNQSFQPSFICPSGHCAWSDISTLGVCSTCKNVTIETSVVCGHPTHQVNSFTCTYTLPNSSLQATYFLDETDGTAQLTRWNSSSKMGGGVPGTEVERQAFLGGFEAIQVFPTNFDSPMPIQAWQCNLALCIKTYNKIEITNSVAKVPSPVEELLFAYDTPESLYGADANWINLTTKSDQRNKSNYKINRADFYNTGNYLLDMFSTSWSDGGGVTLSQPGVPSVGPELAMSSNISESMAMIATSMTEAIRTCPNSTTVLGDVYVQKVFIKVSWGWLALPLTLILLSCVMLFLVAYRTHKEGVPAWKNDSLAILFSRLDGPEYQDISSRAGSKDLESIARDLNVKLSPDGRMLLIKSD